MRHRYIYKYKTGLTKVKARFAIAITALGLGVGGLIGSLALFGAAHAAGGYTLFDDATYVNPGNASNTAVQLSYTPTQPDGGVDFTVPASLTVSGLNNLSTDYQFTSGTCGQGSPRFQINVLGKNVFAYLGPQFPNPSVTPCSGNTYSNSGNVISPTSMVDATQLGNGYETWAAFQTQHGGDSVTGVQLVVDGFTSDSIVAQFDNTAINDTTYDYEPATVTVTIDKYVDGAQATAANTSSASFPMVSSWSAANIGTGSGSYSLSPSGFNNPNPYFATTSDMTVGANYTTNEVLGTNVSATCSINGGYALVGYTTGDSLATAAAATPTMTIPNFTNLQTNEFVIVWNKSCAKLTTSDQCKNNGWMNYGSTFKNQGDCVSFVATNAKNQPSGPAKH